MSATVLVADDGAVRTLTLNRPDKLNALNRELILALTDAFAAADAAPEVAVVVLTGAGRAFCAGADLGDLKLLAGRSAQEQLAHANATMALFGAIQRMDKPVIGAVNGVAVGGGCGLAMSCDWVLAAEDAKLGYPEIRHGALPAVVMANLVRQVGRKAAFELVALGETVAARKAEQLGMINRVGAPGQALAEALAVARTMAGYDHTTLWAIKRLFHRVADQPLQPALETARDFNILMRGFRKPAG